MSAAPAIIEHDDHRSVVSMTPMDMLNRAVSSGANIETLTKLMDLQERYEKNQARRAFDEAISEAKAEISPIVRNATGHNNKKYADFAAIARAVDPVISRHGLSYRFRTEQTDRIQVTCILSHKAGHSEETTLAGPADASGSKNAIQAIGSTLTYLQHYSLTQALGLAASNDDDGHTINTPAAVAIGAAEIAKIRVLLDETQSDIERFCRHMNVEAIPEITTAQYPRAIAMLEKKRSAVK